MKNETSEKHCERCGGTFETEVSIGGARITELENLAWHRVHNTKGVHEQYDDRDGFICDSYHKIPCPDCGKQCNYCGELLFEGDKLCDDRKGSYAHDVCVRNERRNAQGKRVG